MGGIIAPSSFPNSQQSPQSLSSPQYLSHNERERNQCLKLWHDIMNNNIPDYLNNPWIKHCYSTCKLWFDALLLNELLVLTEIRFKSVDVRNKFIETMCELMTLNLQEWEDTNENITEILCKLVIRLGFGYDDLVTFGTAFVRALKILLHKKFTPGQENAWKSVYSSLLFTCISHFVESENVHKKDCRTRSGSDLSREICLMPQENHIVC